MKHRGRSGRSCERFGFPDSPLFARSAASSAGGALAQACVKVVALLYGRRDATTLANLFTNAASVLLVAAAVAALLLRRRAVTKQRRARPLDTGMETWALAGAGDDDGWKHDDDFEIARIDFDEAKAGDGDDDADLDGILLSESDPTLALAPARSEKLYPPMMAASLTLSGSPDDYHPEHPSDYSAMNILDVNEEPAEGDGVPSPATTPKIRRFVADNDPQNSQSN